MLPSGSKIIRSAHASFDGSLQPRFSAPVTEIEMIFTTTKDEHDSITISGLCDLALRATVDLS